MNTTDVMKLVEAQQNPRGIEHWNAMDPPANELGSYGLGLTQLRKLAKEIGRDHALAQQLWQVPYYEAKVLSLLIDDPRKLTRARAEVLVEQLHHGMLAHVFSSCDATLAKTPYVVDLCVEWTQSSDEVRRSCGYGLLYEVSKFSGKKAPDDAFFLARIEHIQRTWAGEGHSALLAIGAALMGIGKRNPVLNAAALKVAREIGPIPGTPGCEPFDVVKHLTSDYLTKKLGLG